MAAHGIHGDRARSLAISVIAILEGAFILSRASRTTEAMDAAGVVATAMVEAALAHRTGGTD